MSIKSSIKSSIMSSIVSSIIAGAKRWFSLYSGAYWTQGVPWASTTDDFEFSFWIRVPDDFVIGSSEVIISSPTGDQPRFRMNNSGKIGVIYLDSLSSSKTTNVDYVLQPGDILECKFVSNSVTGIVLSIAGIESSNSNICDSSKFSINRAGASTNGTSPTQLIVYNVSKIDYAAPTNVEYHPVDEAEGSGLYVIDQLATGPLINLPRSSFLKGNGVDLGGVYTSLSPENFTIKFGWMAQPITGWDSVMIGGDAPGDFAVGQNLGNIKCTFAGVIDFTSSTQPLVVGRVYEVEVGVVVVGTDVTVSYFIDGVPAGVDTQSTSGGGVQISISAVLDTAIHGAKPGVIGDYSITDHDTGDTYEWLCNNLIDNGNGTCTVPNTGNTGSGFDMTVFNCDASDVERIAAASDGLWSQTPQREFL